VFQGDVKDWSKAIDLSGVVGRTKLQLELLKENNELLDKVVQVVRLDDTPPDKLAFVDPPARAVRGRVLTFRARASDAESGISDVVFYLGRPVPTGKLPPETVAVTGTPSEDEEDVWEVDINVAADFKGPLVINVRAINGVGLSATRSLSLAVVDPPGKTATLRGRLFEEEVPIGNLGVGLVNARGKILMVVRAAADGKFEFTGVPPGAYKLIARHRSTRARGELPILIKQPGVVEDLELIMRLPGKKGGTARIEGAVFEGPRAQPGLVVVLADINRRQLDSTKTDAQGRYGFKNVNPGPYKVIATKSASRTRGELPVEVSEGEVKTGVDIKLYR
jgi:hypothetical protein